MKKRLVFAGYDISNIDDYDRLTTLVRFHKYKLLKESIVFLNFHGKVVDKLDDRQSIKELKYKTIISDTQMEIDPTLNIDKLRNLAISILLKKNLMNCNVDLPESNTLKKVKKKFISYLDQQASSYRKINKSVAMTIIQKTDWWLTHLSGPVRAPGQSKHVYNLSGDYFIDYGANTFAISESVSLAMNEISFFLKDFGKNSFEMSISYLKGRLIKSLTKCVKNSDFYDYKNYPLDENNQLVFGAHAIDCNDFINVILKVVPVDLLCYPFVICNPLF